MDPVYRKCLKVRLHEVGHQGKIKLSGILNCFQDASSEQSESLGFSILDTIRRKYKVVVSRYHFRISRFPVWGEEVTVCTWRSGESKGFGIREYEIRDSRGQPLVSATGSFALLDTERRRRVPLKTLYPGYPMKEERALADDFGSLPVPAKVEFERRFQVRRHDLDVNRHVNNTLFLEWALESIPDDIYMRCLPVDVEIAFRKEALFGDGIVSQSQTARGDADHTFLHRILRAKDGKELTALRTGWNRNEGQSGRA